MALLLLGASPVCGVDMRPIALSVRLQSLSARERAQRRIQLYDMHDLVTYDPESVLQQRALVYNVACRKSHCSEMDVVLLSPKQSSSDGQVTRACNAASANSNCHQRDGTDLRPSLTCHSRKAQSVGSQVGSSVWVSVGAHRTTLVSTCGFCSSTMSQLFIP